MAAVRQAVPPLATLAAFAALVRQSAAVNEARVDPILEGAVLAAEQVQDVRIAIVEQQPELTATDFWTEVAITVIIDSNLASKLLSAAAKMIFRPIVRSNALFLALPKSEIGRQLAATAKEFEAVFPGSGRSVLREGSKKLPGTASTDALKLYHSSLRLFATQASKLDYAKAAVKVANQVARPKNRPRSIRRLGAPDSAGVAVLHSAMEYAAATRLGIRFTHAELERAAWSATSFDDLAALKLVVDWDDLSDPDEKDAFDAGLTTLRREVARFVEALIWSRMYAFSVGDLNRPGSVDNPPTTGQEGKTPFTTIKATLQDYWYDRFQPDADAYATSLGKQLANGRLAAALRLRVYFAAISYAVEKAGISLGRQALNPAPSSP